MICKNCGENNAEGARFCRECGAKLIQPEKQTAEKTDLPKEQPQISGSTASTGKAANTAGTGKAVNGNTGNGKKKWPAVLAAAAAVVIIGAAATAVRYKNTFQTDVEEFQSIQQTYALGQYEAEYKKLGQQGEDVLKKNSFMDISKVKSSMAALEDEIIQWNDKNAEQFKQEFQKFSELEKKQVLGSYEKEYKALQKEADGYNAAQNYIGYSKILEPMQKLCASIESMNEKVAEYKSVYDDTVEAFKMLYLSQDEKDDYESYCTALEDALDQFDVDKCETASAEFSDYQKEIEQENISGIEKLKYSVEDFDTDELYDVEEDEFRKHIKEAENSYGEKNYAKAYKNYRACDKQISLVEKSYPYSANLEQVDISEFPKVKLYLSIRDFATGNYIDNLDPVSFRLMEATSDGGGYRKLDVLSADKMDGNEKLNIAMVADCSASMDDDFEYGQDIMDSFLYSMQTEAGDQAALYSFSDYMEREMYFTSDTDALSEAIYDLEMGHNTALYDALVLSLSDIAVQDGAKCVIAFTDGKENCSSSSREFVIRKANENHVPIYLIGIGSSVNGAELRDIAESTGGFYVNIDDISYMEDIYDQIYRDQKSMYVVQYDTDAQKPTNVGRSVYISYHDGTRGVRMQDEYTPSEYKINGFVFFDSDSRYLTEDELDELTEIEVLIALNEIYARRGYKFTQKQEVISHFNSCSWYNGTEEDMQKVYGMFNDYERKNVDLLVNYECKHHLNEREK